jgi:hypothetical protein
MRHPEHAASDSAESLKDAEDALTRSFATTGAEFEPLAVVARVFDLSNLELRMLLLSLAPELDLRYQRCIGVLLDDLGRRVGTLGLYTALLGESSRFVLL